MIRSASEFEVELAHEFGLDQRGNRSAANEWEFERPGEHETEFESERFFGRLVGAARRGAETVRQAGVAAAQAVLRALSGPGGAPVLRPQVPPGYRDPAPRDCSVLPPEDCSGRCGDGGTCSWSQLSNKCVCKGSRTGFGDSGSERDETVAGVPRVSVAGLMEHLGHVAAKAENEFEADAAIGALVPLAARCFPRAAPVLLRSTPALIRGAVHAAHVLRGQSLHPLVRTLPLIVRRTGAEIARRADRGQWTTPNAAVQLLSRHTSRLLSSPQQCIQAWRHSRALERQLQSAR